MEEALLKRVLPHSIEAEKSVLGSMIINRDAIVSAIEIISADDFILSKMELFLNV